MTELSPAALAERFRRRTQQGDLDGLEMVVRLFGGAPDDTGVDAEVRLTGRSPVALRRLNRSATLSELQPDQQTISDLLRDVGGMLDQLTPRLQAEFLPDSLVGAVEITVDGQSTTLFYDADPDSAERSRRTSRANEVIGHLDQLLTSVDQGPTWS